MPGPNLEYCNESRTLYIPEFYIDYEKEWIEFGEENWPEGPVRIDRLTLEACLDGKPSNAEITYSDFPLVIFRMHDLPDFLIREEVAVIYEDRGLGRNRVVCLKVLETNKG